MLIGTMPLHRPKRAAIIRLLAFSLALAATACRNNAPPHALDPLTAAEIDAVRNVLDSAQLLPDSVVVLHLVLLEPLKPTADLNSNRRVADVRLFDVGREQVTDYTVDIADRRILSSQPIEDAAPPFTRFDLRTANTLLRNDTRWTDAIAKRGLTMDSVNHLYMGPGEFDPNIVNPSHRYLRVTSSHRGAPSAFVAPIEGLAAFVDLTERRVVEIVDEGVVPVKFDTASIFPSERQSRAEWSRSKFDVVVRGNEINWNGWTLRYALHPREGLVLYRVAFAPPGTPPRMILARASLAEMLVPYGDVSRAWTFRNVFDVGEYGLGSTAALLIPNEDVPPGALLFDATIANDRAQPSTIPRAIGVYERDGGLRWRHRNRAQRARELVVRYATTVGNYDYGFSWVFSPDGTLAMEIDLTGMMQVKGIEHNDERFGVQVAPHLSAIHHQHFFSFRLDFDIDGLANHVREIEVLPLPTDSTNLLGTGFAHTSRVLETEQLAARDANTATSRFWVVEAGTDDAHQAPGYALIPVPIPQLLADSNSRLARRGAFATNQLWVTRYARHERFAAGEFPGQDTGYTGVARFVADNQPVRGEDLVVWYTVGLTHVPRPEEWPIMPVSRLRFELRPSNFVKTAGVSR